MEGFRGKKEKGEMSYSIFSKIKTTKKQNKN